MTTELSRLGGNGMVARQGLNAPPLPMDLALDDVFRLGEVLAKNGYFKDVTDAAKAVVKILYGRELGIQPVSALLGIHIIESKPSPSANLLAAMVKRSGRYNYRVQVHTETECVLAFTEHGEACGPPVKWTIQDATRAGLAGKPVWKNYPRQMLFSRCMSEGVRTYCPDLFGGAPVYTPEELGAEVNGESGEPILTTGNGAQVYRETGEVVSDPNPDAEAEDRARRVATWTGKTPAAQQAVERAETQQNFANSAGVPPTAPDERRELQKRWHAQLREHCGDMTDGERHAFTALILGVKDVPSEKRWDAGGYREALDALKAHVETCVSTTTQDACPELLAAMQNPAEAPTTSEAPAANPPVELPLVCTNEICRKVLTKGQRDVSIRAFGRPLCPPCQKTEARG